MSKANAGGSFGSRPRATLPSVKTIFALIALLLPAGGSVALADEPAAPAAPEAIVAYQDSGEWAQDTTRVVRRARRYIRRHLDDSSRRAAIVLDIDDTSLSNYECLNAVGFDRSSADCADQTLPAIAQTRSLFRWAREKGVAVFFVTGRREEARQQTAANLRAAGYRGGWTLKMRPDEQPQALARRLEGPRTARNRPAARLPHPRQPRGPVVRPRRRLVGAAVQAPEPDVRDPDRLTRSPGRFSSRQGNAISADPRRIPAWKDRRFTRLLLQQAIVIVCIYRVPAPARLRPWYWRLLAAEAVVGALYDYLTELDDARRARID